ncbi:MAG: sodium:proton antiporter [Candidatus Eremiobacter antarcticus]|nr:cation:proton antiporter [Candidatus Eremiobacteraeota bacterium]PZR62345.1 MAG: sodium:proton antiporter [Candidatus Eremiobacter sp. RRmetagenome_bin22]
MTTVSFSGLFVIAAVAFLAPLLLGLAPRLRVPAVVLEIVVGIVIGPSVLGWVHIDLPIAVLSMLGLAFLLFLAGLEIDVECLQGAALRLASTSLALSFALGLAVGYLAFAAGLVKAPLFLAIVLLATSLGLLVPVLKDAGQTQTKFGQFVIAAASLADFAAVLLLSLLFSRESGSLFAKVLLLFGFALSVALIAVTIARAERFSWLSNALNRLQDTTAQIRVRGAVVLLIGLVALAAHFGVELLLAAFMAGTVLSLVDRDEMMSHPQFRTKLQAIGYGFLIPIFFIASGVQFDLGSLLAAPASLLKVPVFLVAMLVVRGLPAILYVRYLGARLALVAGILKATSLPFIVVGTQIGLALGVIQHSTAAAFVAAGLISVLVFPAVGLALSRGRTPAVSADAA